MLIDKILELKKIEKIKIINLFQNTFLLICLNLVVYSLFVYTKINKQNTLATISRENKNYEQLYEKYISLESENTFQKNKNNPLSEAQKIQLHPIESSDILK